MRPVLANLGFVLQIAGLLMLIPIAAGFYYDETSPLISFFLVTLVFFGSGFLLNAFYVRKKLELITSSALLFLVFIILGIIGSIPYLYNRVFPGGLLIQITDSFFESISGYTTTGFSLVPDIDRWPRSLILYHGLTQWIGGIGIVFILLAFFYPSKSVTVSSLARIVGIDKIKHGIRKVMVHILFIYTVLAVTIAAALYLAGVREIHQTVSLVFAAISTGGFSAVTDSSRLFVKGINWILTFAMLAGAINFLMIDNMLGKKFKEWFKKEFILFLCIMAGAVIIFFFVSKLDFTNSVFNVISASTTTGFSQTDMAKLDEASKLILIFLMFVGGMSVSTAGGIKVFRLMLFFKIIPWSIKRYIFDTKEELIVEGEGLPDKEVFIHLLIPPVAIFIIFLSTLLFTLAGSKFVDSLFEVVSAFSTTGLSTNVAASASPALKWLLGAIMILGRIEILPFLIILAARQKPGAVI